MKKLIIILMFPLFSQAQWITKNDIVLITLQSISGAADGLNQSIIHHRFGENSSFWNYKTSWKRKYNDFDEGDKSAAFPGSKSWLVFATDGYHLTRTIDKTAMLASIGISTYDFSKVKKRDRWKVVLKKIIISTLTNKLLFVIIYNNTGK